MSIPFSDSDGTKVWYLQFRISEGIQNGAAMVLVLAPTGKAVDVAVRAGDEGLTIAKVLQMLRDNELAPQLSLLLAGRSVRTCSAAGWTLHQM